MLSLCYVPQRYFSPESLVAHECTNTPPLRGKAPGTPAPDPPGLRRLASLERRFGRPRRDVGDPECGQSVPCVTPKAVVKTVNDALQASALQRCRDGSVTWACRGPGLEGRCALGMLAIAALGGGEWEARRVPPSQATVAVNRMHGFRDWEARWKAGIATTPSSFAGSGTDGVSKLAGNFPT